MPDFSLTLKAAARVASYLSENAAHIDVEGAFPTLEFQWLREANLLSAPLPLRFGGVGLGTTPGSTPSLLRTLWHIGYGNLAVGRLYEGHVNALQLIEWFGSETQKNCWFADALDGQIFAVWNTQTDNGVSFEGSGDGIMMQGAKTFCSGAGHVLRPIVTGELTQGGWQMAVIPFDAVSASIDKSWWQPLGMRASASYKTDFSGAQLSPEDLLGEPGAYYEQPYFSGGAIRFCAVQLGGAASLFDATRRFLRDCGRSGDAFQQARLGQMAMKIESGNLWLERAGKLWDAAPAPEKMVAFAAMMRVATEEICVSVLEMCEKSVGARGLMRGLPFERIGRDLTIYLKQPHLDEIPLRVGRFALESEARSDVIWD